MNDLYRTVNYIALRSHIFRRYFAAIRLLILHLAYSYAARTTIYHLSKDRKPRRDSPPMSGALNVQDHFKPGRIGKEITGKWSGSAFPEISSVQIGP